MVHAELQKADFSLLPHPHIFTFWIKYFRIQNPHFRSGFCALGFFVLLQNASFKSNKGVRDKQWRLPYDFSVCRDFLLGSSAQHSTLAKSILFRTVFPSVFILARAKRVRICCHNSSDESLQDLPLVSLLLVEIVLPWEEGIRKAKFQPESFHTPFPRALCSCQVGKQDVARLPWFDQQLE